MKPLLIMGASLALAMTLLAASRDAIASRRDAVNPPGAEVATATAGVVPQRGRDAGTLRDVINGIRGANAIQCELLLQAFTGWTSNVPDRDVQAWTVSRRLWERVEDPADIAWLGEQVRGADPCVARASIRVLGRSPAPAARSLLVSGLTDTDPRVRRLAAFGIGFREDSTANGQLVRLLGDVDAGVRAAAAWALGAVN